MLLEIEVRLVTFTIPQQNAIHARNRELLVSAAAGSGKTKVLVERIFHLVAEDGYLIDRMLVVTFTSAAAAEMRERLEVRFEEADTQSAHMRHQAERVENAQISTLHSFCQKLIREFFQVVSIDPLASLAEESLQAKLMEQAVAETTSQCYELAQENPYLKVLTRKFSPDEIARMLADLYHFLMSLPHPFQWLSRCVEHVYGPEDLTHGPMADTLLQDCRVILDGALGIWQQVATLAIDPCCREGYAKTLVSDGALLSSLHAAAYSSLSTLLERVANCTFTRMPSLKLTDPSEIRIRDLVKEARERYKKRLEEIKKRLPQNVDQSIADLQEMSPALQGLAQAAQMLHQKYEKLKEDRNVIDFSDLEHKTIAILSQPELQRIISSRFDALFVDEYQDISEIQEAILEALKPCQEGSSDQTDPQDENQKSRNTRLPFTCFYVGDVKQSIYRFRLADPTLFMDKQEQFQDDPQALHRKISLSHNFRSREAVIDAVNRVFSHVMRADVTEIEYDDNARLYPGIPSQRDPAPQVHIVNSKGLRSADQPQEEAKIIADEIHRLLRQPVYDREGQETHPLTYKDIAILMPAARGKAPLVIQTLQDAGIPVYAEDNTGDGESIELVQALAHLRLLNNLMDDLSLLTVLRGPLYQLSEEELGQIRLFKPDAKASFLEAMMAASTSMPPAAIGKRCRSILSELEKERFLQQNMPLGEYLWDFFTRSGLYRRFGLAPGGKERQANLQMLCHQAGEFVARRGGSLHDFLESITSSQGIHDGKSPTLLGPNENVVRIMTIHKSKGLEFPVVFVMGLGGRLHKGKGMRDLQTHSKLGIALPYINEKARTRRDTLLSSAIHLRHGMEEKAERARLLYVAMTRARDSLYMLGCSSSLTADDLMRKSGEGDVFHNQSEKKAYGGVYAVWEAKSMLEWIWQTLESTDEIRAVDSNELSTTPLWETEYAKQFSTDSTSFPQKKGGWRVVFHNDADLSGVSQDVEKPATLHGMKPASSGEKVVQDLLSGLHSKVSQENQFQEDLPAVSLSPGPLPVPLPLKMGVTALCRSLEEGNGKQITTIALTDQPDNEFESAEAKRLPLPLARPRLLADLPSLPAYLRGSPPQTALMRGVATHKALSLLPLAPLQDARGADKDRQFMESLLTKMLSSLVKDGKLTSQEKELIAIQSLVGFFDSPLGRRTLLSREVHREWSFNMRLPWLSPSILQGVIDLCFLEDQAWVLVDFKTDRVEKAADLEKLYHQQIEIYRQALASSTGYSVKESVLFSLPLGEGFSIDSADDSSVP